jgi:hypothetical protein
MAFLVKIIRFTKFNYSWLIYNKVVDPALSNPIVMIHSGQIVPPVTVSQGNKLSVRFQSDAYMHDIPGFIAEYSMIDQ